MKNLLPVSNKHKLITAAVVAAVGGIIAGFALSGGKNDHRFYMSQAMIRESILEGSMPAAIPPVSDPVFLRRLAKREAASVVPPNVVLHFNTYVRLLPGCVWPNQTHSIAITRHINQGFDFINLGFGQHTLTEQTVSTDKVPSNLGDTRPQYATGIIFSKTGTHVFTTCDGKTKLSVSVS